MTSNIKYNILCNTESNYECSHPLCTNPNPIEPGEDVKLLDYSRYNEFLLKGEMAQTNDASTVSVGIANPPGLPIFPCRLDLSLVLLVTSATLNRPPPLIDRTPRACRASLARDIQRGPANRIYR